MSFLNCFQDIAIERERGREREGEAKEKKMEMSEWIISVEVSVYLLLNRGIPKGHVNNSPVSPAGP